MVSVLFRLTSLEGYVGLKPVIDLRLEVEGMENTTIARAIITLIVYHLLLF